MLQNISWSTSLQAASSYFHLSLTTCSHQYRSKEPLLQYCTRWHCLRTSTVCQAKFGWHCAVWHWCHMSIFPTTYSMPIFAGVGAIWRINNSTATCLCLISSHVRFTPIWWLMRLSFFSKGVYYCKRNGYRNQILLRILLSKKKNGYRNRKTATCTEYNEVAVP